MLLPGGCQPLGEVRSPTRLVKLTLLHSLNSLQEIGIALY